VQDSLPKANCAATFFAMIAAAAIRQNGTPRFAKNS
jgi:hypothetical protein